MKRIYYLLILPFSVWYGCTKDDATKDTPNTWSRVSCYTSGHYWSDCSKDVAGRKMANANGLLTITDSVQNMVMIFDRTCGEGCTYCINRIAMRLYDYKGVGSYTLDDPSANNNTTNSYASCFKGMPDGGQVWCYTIGLGKNVVEVTKYDTLNRTVSGKFYFDLYYGIQDTVRVTSGSFRDVPYTVQ